LFWIVVTTLLAGCATGPSARAPDILDRVSSADAAYESGDLDTAEAIYLRLLAAAPPAVEARFRLGVIAYHRGRLDDAERYFQRVLADDPEHARATYDLAMVHLERARRLLRRYEALEPANAAAPALTDLRKAMERLARSTPGASP
jgi:tetratricopeptide (TPR) repeat protein